jgi:hypothetical protein
MRPKKEILKVEQTMPIKISAPKKKVLVRPMEKRTVELQAVNKKENPYACRIYTMSNHDSIIKNTCVIIIMVIKTDHELYNICQSKI